MKSRSLFSAYFWFLALGVFAVPAQAQSLEGIDEVIETAMAGWQVPGLAIAVIRDGDVLLAKGYGYRDVERQLPVTENTLFAIGSNSKSFTVTVLGMLVDEGKLDWDEPVQTYMPDFQLYDDVATEHMTARDLVTHRSGLPRHDGLWYGSDLSRYELYERLRYLEPNRDFRAVYQYQNLMFMTAGILAEKLGQDTWENLVRERILNPLGMIRSNFSVNDMHPETEDAAVPYVMIEETRTKVPYRNIDNVAPAGSINSSVSEMIRYIQFHIDTGAFEGEQLLSEATAADMQMPHMAIQGTLQYDELGHGSYGMGLNVTSYRGEKVVQHGGGIDGFISAMSWMPRRKIGVMVLTNLSGTNPVPTIVVRAAYDRALGLEPVDWIARVKERQEEQERREEEAEENEESDRIEGASPSHPLEAYTGTFEHSGYGKLSVELSNGALEWTYHNITGALEHYHYNVFETADDPMNPLGGVKVVFRYNKRGIIDRIEVPLESNVDDIVFVRAADEKLEDPSYLGQFVGVYELAGQDGTIELRGDVLTLIVSGQPPYRLVPTREMNFDIEGLSGFSIEFRKTGDSVSELVAHQPNGTFVAKRKQ
ncbi:MAG: serine hydrolase [Gemmatimonadota bacterium]|nr:MAG: serine hydrolase [Gemmatimonadota bacterium]